MKVDGNDLRPIWLDQDQSTLKIIDQRRLPHELVIENITTVDAVIFAIKDMMVRGAPLIGVTAAYGVYLAALNAAKSGVFEDHFVSECEKIKAARPTAVNLVWAVDRVLGAITEADTLSAKVEAALKETRQIEAEEVQNCRKIGQHGVSLIEKISQSKGGDTVDVLTHCNAGWLACIEYGTATAPIYAAFEKGFDIHVWVDETRPLNQGARLTAWELGKHGVKHTVVADNAGGHLMQHGRVDLVIVGSDRTTRTGDVANKIGTYLKAVAARDNGIPFYAALPSSTIDWQLKDGLRDIPIEERNPDEIRYIKGLHQGQTTEVLLPPADSPAGNFAFDVTPARLVTGLITERGICAASEAGIRRLFPEKS